MTGWWKNELPDKVQTDSAIQGGIPIPHVRRSRNVYTVPFGGSIDGGVEVTRPQYHNHPDGWTAVLTPHFIETWRKRTDGRTSLSMMEWVSKVGRKFDQIGDDVPSGGEILNSAFGGPVVAFGYFNRRYNQRRGRWELEMIDVAPPKRFNTKGRSSHGNSHEDTVFMDVNDNLYSVTKEE